MNTLTNGYMIGVRIRKWALHFSSTFKLSEDTECFPEKGRVRHIEPNQTQSALDQSVAHHCNPVGVGPLTRFAKLLSGSALSSCCAGNTIIVVLLTALAATGLPVVAQIKPEVTVQDVANNAVGQQRVLVRAIGKRLVHAGKERTTFSASFETAAPKSSALTVLYEFPGKIAFVRPDSSQSILDVSSKTKDQRPPANSSYAEQRLLEALAADSIEGYAQAIGEGSRPKLVATQATFKLNHFGLSDINGCNLYSLTGFPGEGIWRSKGKTKLYCFDMDTGFLKLTAYQEDDRFVHVHFTNWQSVEGAVFPGRIEVREGAELVCSLTMSSIVSAAKQNAAK